MKHIQKIFFCVFLLHVFFINDLFSKGINLGLTKIKNRIEKALKNSVKETKESINRLIRKDKNKNQKDLDKKALAKAIEIDGSGSVQGLDLLQSPIKKFCKKVSVLISNNNYLFNQENFIKDLEENFKNNKKDQAKKLLQNKILEKYSDQKAPILKFVADLDNQEKEIAVLFTEMQKLLEKKSEIKDPKQVEYFEKTIKNLNTIKENFETFYKITSDLLI